MSIDLLLAEIGFTPNVSSMRKYLIARFQIAGEIYQ